MSSFTRPLSNFGFAVASLLISLVLGELVIRQWVVVRAIGPTVTIHHPQYGKTLKPSFTARRITPEFDTIISTNSLGFRGPELGTMKRQPFLFLGDSFTMGYGVGDGQEFPALVGRTLGVPIINAGVGDTGTGRVVKFLRNEGATYNPALVVLQLHDTDFDDNLRERLFGLDGAGRLIELPVPAPSRSRQAWEALAGLPILGPIISNSYIAGLIRQSRWNPQGPRHRGSPSEDFSLKARLTARLVDEALTICQRAGWPVLVLVVQIRDDHLIELRQVFGVHHVQVVTIPTHGERPDLYYPIDGHLNVTGHQFTAERIVESLRPPAR